MGASTLRSKPYDLKRAPDELLADLIEGREDVIVQRHVGLAIKLAVKEARAISPSWADNVEHEDLRSIVMTCIAMTVRNFAAEGAPDDANYVSHNLARFYAYVNGAAKNALRRALIPVTHNMSNHFSRQRKILLDGRAEVAGLPSVSGDASSDILLAATRSLFARFEKDNLDIVGGDEASLEHIWTRGGAHLLRHRLQKASWLQARAEQEDPDADLEARQHAALHDYSVGRLSDSIRRGLDDDEGLYWQWIEDRHGAGRERSFARLVEHACFKDEDVTALGLVQAVERVIRFEMEAEGQTGVNRGTVRNALKEQVARAMTEREIAWLGTIEGVDETLLPTFIYVLSDIWAQTGKRPEVNQIRGAVLDRITPFNRQTMWQVMQDHTTASMDADGEGENHALKDIVAAENISFEGLDFGDVAWESKQTYLLNGGKGAWLAARFATGLSIQAPTVDDESVGRVRHEGLSVRAIADILGVNADTVSRHVQGLMAAIAGEAEVSDLLPADGEVDSPRTGRQVVYPSRASRRKVR